MPDRPDERVQAALVELSEEENVEDLAEYGIDHARVFLVGDLGQGEDALKEEDGLTKSAA